ncbi:MULTISPECIES: hypothetical protein [unclassified Sphingomonas]|uniref:hypothetical protein n=1 Tax=unclassified Sphingomonas TaxID=196159 RepID=UPI0021512E2C|nr:MULTISPECIES: hypothetical protein [unclassified Sphingomonas]MCR5870260.1 hypothetical protein [Sphingomonas sp. J344]UUX98050.1 hypothetical protein LRS08_10465 [Sphingomonas sp. J315]
MVDTGGGGLWGVMTILGPIILAAVILWAIFNNRTTKREKERTEDATRAMYDAQNEEDTRREP